MTDDRERLRQWFEHEQRHPRQAVIQALDSLGLENGDRVADIGCGPGVHLAHIYQRVAPDGEVVGIDTNPERLAIASEMMSDSVERGSIRLVEGDVHDLDAGLGRFDLVWMSLVLHHEAIPAEVVGGLKSIVVPDGRIAVMDGDDAASFPFLRWPPDFELTVRRAVARAALERGGERNNPGRRYTARNFISIFRNAGLADIQLRAYSDLQQAPLDAASTQEIRDWLLGSLGTRVREHMTPADWRRYESFFVEGSPESLLETDDFFMARTWFLAVGTVD